MEQVRTQVLIVGAGPVGLAMALELGIRGIDCIVAERRDGIVSVPKMSMVSTRNMEFCRRWGIADEVRNAVWDEERELDFVYAESLTGRELARLAIPSYRSRRDTAPSPELSCHCPQLYFDPILRRRVERQSSVKLMYEAAVESFQTAEEGVLATVSGQRSAEIACDYLVGCDGAGSLVRSRLGILLEGHGVMARSVNILFRAQRLVEQHDKGWARIYRIVDANGCWGELIPIDGKDLWRLTVFDEPGAADAPGHFLKCMFGGEFDYELLDVSGWDRRDFVASSYRCGRFFIAGDAAHQCSPTGGLGMATGIEEAVNLAWKLAAVLCGWGGPRLLDTYESERRPVALRNVALSTRAFQAIRSIPPWHEGLGNASLESWRRDLGVYSIPDHLKFQYAYHRSPICVPDGSREPLPEPQDYTPSAAPGARPPHVWLSQDESIFDRFGGDFTLLRFGEITDPNELVAALRACGAPVRLAEVHNETATRLYGARLVLIRPDGHVAWRGDHVTEPGAIADIVRGAA